MYLLNVSHSNYVFFFNIVSVVKEKKLQNKYLHNFSSSITFEWHVLLHLIVYGSDLDLSSIQWISVKTRTCDNNIVCT